MTEKLETVLDKISTISNLINLHMQSVALKLTH